MPNNDQTDNNPTPQIPPMDDTTSSVVVEPTTEEPTAAGVPSTVPEVVKKINEAHNILVALSSDPSVDEMATAIGISLYLDRFGKRVTAIYSGETPNALEFLKPEETFETSADVLQDFVIALNKEKADHLRYKLDGSFVKIFITPYRDRIDAEDLEFSYGDYNVDLVLALNVANGVDLDAALREHGRIMHDASIINITTGNPGKFGDLEWSDKGASSVAEMISKMLFGMGDKNKMEPAEATAFLTGIVAATDHFSKANTTAESMNIASKLMESGANQQLISENITKDLDNNFYSISDSTKKSFSTELPAMDVEHDGELLDELKAAESSLANAGAETTPEDKDGPVRLDDLSNKSAESAAEPSLPTIEPAAKPEPESAESEPTPTPSIPTINPIKSSTPASDPQTSFTPAPELPPIMESTVPAEPTTDAPADFTGENLAEGTNKYGQMLEDALNEAGGNPAASFAPPVASTPEINGVPEINYGALENEAVLPPPPTPPVDFGAPLPASDFGAQPAASDFGAPLPPTDFGTQPTGPTLAEQAAMPAPAPVVSPLGDQPAMQDQVYGPQATDPAAFRIPGA